MELSKKGFKIGQTRPYSAGVRIEWIVENDLWKKTVRSDTSKT
jgi:hypothetical protein